MQAGAFLSHSMTRTYLDSFNRPAEPPEPETLSDDEIISLAQRRWATFDDVQIYDDAKVDADDSGAWVEAYIWVSYPENDS